MEELCHQVFLNNSQKGCLIMEMNTFYLVLIQTQ